MELTQKPGKWKYNDEYQVHVTNSLTESDNVDEKTVYMEDLKKREEVYGICVECNEPGTGKEWCQPCNARRFKKNFKNWTSGKEDIDGLIQNSQINAVHSTKCLEWIPYLNFKNIVPINKEISNKIYSADWPEGNIYSWSIENQEWKRYSNKKVALKSLANSSDISIDFLNEVKSHIQIYTRNIIQCYAPEVLRENQYTKAIDVYSFGIIMNEYISEKFPYNDTPHDHHVLTVKICSEGFRPKISENTPKLFIDLITKCWDAKAENRPTAKELCQILNKWNKEKYNKDSEIYFQISQKHLIENLSSEQLIIRQFKLNHGLFLDGFSMKASKHAIFIEDGELNMSLYDSQPLVYISINVNDSRVNLLSFNSDNNIDYDKTLQPSDICINFPVFEITYTADFSESFLNSRDSGVTLYEKYGHLFARKVLVGGKLFINGLKSATSAQADAFKSLLTWTYNLAKYNKENLFMNLPTPNFFPKIRTLDGEDLNTYEKLTNWMTNLYKNNMVDIISYNNLIPVSELRFSESSSIDEKQPGVLNFKERLSFEDWAVYANLIRWINENNLFQGLIIDKHFELALSKKIAVNFTKIPDVDSSNQSYLKMIKPITKMEEFLTSNNIFSVKDIGSLPFIKEIIRSENISYKDYTHLLLKLEKYRITSDIIPSEEFKQAIEKALESMKPFICLQNVFDEFGHFFPLNIVLGKSLKNILRIPMSYNSEEIYLGTESLSSHLDKLNVSYLLTEKGDVIKTNDLSNWIQNTNNRLEVIEFDNIISLHCILEMEQKKKIDVILNKKNNLKIIITGIDELKDLDINNTEHYKRINIEPSLEDEDYEVFGSVISKDNLRLEDFLVTFGLYDINGFSTMIKTLKNTNTDITECYILWMVIGNPSKLSVFSPRNREFQVDCIKESITLQSNNSYYPVKTSYELSEGCTISVNAHCSTANYEPINIKIKMAGWSEDCIYFQIIETNLDSSDIISDQLTSIEIIICVLYSNYENLKIDNRKVENSLDSIGCILTESTKVIPFLPLISEISNSCNETIGLLKQRVDVVDSAVRDLKKDKQGFFDHKNHIYLQNLVKVTTQIKNFMTEISQMKTLLKYIKAKSIEETFKDLCEEFDNCINSLAFTNTNKNSDKLEQLKADQEDLTKYPGNTDIDMKKSNDDVTEVETTMKFKNEDNNNNSYVHQLEFIDYEKTDEKPHKNGRVTKWVSVKNKSEEFAFKIISEEEKNMVQNQIRVLKELHDWQNVIKIYGLTYKGNKWYLVSEWAKYGNLREYYTNYKDRFNLRLKLRMSLDIARGLNFLRTVEIVHHDIRAENILITLHETAKLANFKFNRSSFTGTLEQSQNLERVRYCAPELLESAHNFKYDHKCEVYSFGILLWEIAEERTPYEQYNDIVKITDMVCNHKYRESFSKDSQMPLSFTSLALKAVDHDPKFRPEISKMLVVLSNCFEEFKTQVSYIPDIPQNLETTSKHILQNEYDVLDDNLQNLVVASSSSIAMQTEVFKEIVPFSKFHPLINEIRSIFYEIIYLDQAAEHNKRICNVLKQRVYAVDLATFELNIMRNFNQEFFNRKNYSSLQSLVSVITQIKRFISDISQMKNLIKLKYVQPKNIEKTFKGLCRELDICIINIDSESFRDMVNNKIHTEEETKSLKLDQEDLSNYLAKIEEEIGSGIGELSNEFSLMVLKINAMNNTMEKLLDEQTKQQSKNYNDKTVNDKLKQMIQSKIDKIFAVRQLRISDYEKTDEESRKGRVTKWVNVRNKGEEFAFKIITEKERANVQNQVTILKELHDWQNITRIYGLTCEENKWYLVSEWAEYGNLREYYINYKDRFDIRLKLRISLDIARGLNFLRAVEIVHRDVRAKNILITLHETAKLANFKFSRSLFTSTSKQSQNLERVRYCAPELLERAHNFKYDHKCEVYSFGILLWEIAEERTPYEEYKDIVRITDLVRNKKYRESFSKDSRMPSSFIELSTKATNHDPEFRPKLTDTFEVLSRCFEEYERPSKSSSNSKSTQFQNITLSSPDPIPSLESIINQDEYAIKSLSDYESFKYMTLAEAAKQHKMFDRQGKPSGDTKTAYKCFESYADADTTIRNKIVAKYYKAYYISRGLVDNIEDKDKDRIVAELYKEVADDEENEFPEAKLRYGDCLYNGKGVEKNLSEALKYFEQAADNGFKVAMYNAGKLYYNGDGIERNKEKAIRYMKLAIYNEYEPAMKFCRDNNINLN
ncbi:uncharacterized protein OCT59_006926 [Rhizophagus irregularis]|nr:hypothetical protein OCT59_006926 [Rhizophagus irregularis]